MDLSPTPSLSVIIPVYNGSYTLTDLVDQLMDTLKNHYPNFEIILVNDGSYDNSWEIIQEISKKHEWVIGINLMRNYGQHNALLCGIRAATKEVIITMDDDLQHPPHEIPTLVNKLSEGFDVVYGFPRKLPHSFWRNIFSRLTKRTLAFVMGVKTVSEISAFRAFKTKIRNAFASYNSPGVIVDALLSWGTENFSSVLVNENKREKGKSNYNFLKLVNQSLLILTGYSTFPLRLASWIGFLITIIGLGVLIYVVVIYFTLGSIPGFPFLASIISIFSGAQLFSLGIFGEYIARIFDRSLERPTYIVKTQIRRSVGFDEK